MLCGECRGNGYILIKIEENESIEYQAVDCPECLGVGEIKFDTTPNYPDSYGNNDYDE